MANWLTLVCTVILSLIALLLIAFQTTRVSCNAQRSLKPSLAYIIRGILFDPKRVPLSGRGAKKEYKIDIRELWSTHKEMIKVLSELYEVQVIFSTYDDTPYSVKVWAGDRGELLISKKKNSTQFTTALTALTSTKWFDYYFMTRSDIQFLPAMYSIVNIYPRNVTVLNLEMTRYNINDIIHFLPQSKYEEFYRFIEDIVHEKKKSAHSKPEGMTVDVLTSDMVPYVRHKNTYYNLLGHMHDPLDLSGQKILFLGPADTKGAREVDTLAYDVVVITNNMVQIFDRPHKTLLVVANDYFSINHTDRIVTRAPDAVLCTTANGVNAILSVSGAPGVRQMPRPSVAGTPLGLSFFMNYAIQYPFASLHITGVTFYSGGHQSYVDGYGLLPMADHHNIEANKQYARALLRRYKNITIDFPL